MDQNVNFLCSLNLDTVCSWAVLSYRVKASSYEDIAVLSAKCWHAQQALRNEMAAHGIDISGIVRWCTLAQKAPPHPPKHTIIGKGVAVKGFSGYHSLFVIRKVQKSQLFYPIHECGAHRKSASLCTCSIGQKKDFYWDMCRVSNFHWNEQWWKR